MKKCLTLLIATVLSGISLTAYAAQPMSNLDSGQLRPAGTVSATGASTLSDLEDKLAEKARAHHDNYGAEQTADIMWELLKKKFPDLAEEEKKQAQAEKSAPK